MRVLTGVILGLVLGKPIGVLLASWLTIEARIGVAPQARAGACSSARPACVASVTRSPC
jgi:Na+/H+ antiporter NhaA